MKHRPTKRQLVRKANALLRSAGYFKPVPKREDRPVDPAMISRFGLRPLWQGRA